MSQQTSGHVDEIHRFLAEEVTPLEEAHDGDIASAGGDATRIRLQAMARERGILSPHVPVDLGGLGLDLVGRAPLFEAAGRSLFGPLALNIQAPDEGNVHLMDKLATDSQREQFLKPLAVGQVRSAFAMTEPHGGAGSDPSRLRTMARRTDRGWSISGRKIFITGADGAAFHIVMARTSGDVGEPGGATMFLVGSSSPGVRVIRHVGTQDRSMIGGHCEVEYVDVEVTDDDVLGEVDEGFRNAQVRLGPARMTHVMRWTGAAQVAHEAAGEVRRRPRVLRRSDERPGHGSSTHR